MILKLKPHLTLLNPASLLTHTGFRLAVAVAYTALLTLVLVQSSAKPMLGPAAPKDYDLGWDVLLTFGHLAGFGGLVLLNWAALVRLTPPRRALLVAVVFACLLGLVTELLQMLVPDRSASLFDLVCDWGVSLAVAFVINRRYSLPAKDEVSPKPSLPKPR